jgi:hypothetical protein
MDKKICKQCSIEKSFDSFSNNKRNKDGKEPNCRACLKENNNTPEKKALNALRNREWRERNPEYMKQYGQLDKSKTYHKQYYKENRELYITRKQEWRKANPIQAILENKAYIAANKEKVNEYHREWKKNKRINDITYKIKENISRRIRYELNTLLTKGKKQHTIDYLGCSIDYLKIYLEGRFEIGMNWNNYGKIWHIDHIIPCASWNFKNQFDNMCCWNYRNLQPIWALTNKSKGDTYTEFKKEVYIDKMKLLLIRSV